MPPLFQEDAVTRRRGQSRQEANANKRADPAHRGELLESDSVVDEFIEKIAVNKYLACSMTCVGFSIS